MKLLLVFAGLGQIGLAAGSIAVPYVLKWAQDMAKVRPITRQIFHTYSIYIWATNLCFGLLSLLRPGLLLDGTPLAKLVAGFITVYWGARLFIQFFYYDRSIRPTGAIWAFAEWSLAGLFAYLTLIYGRIAFMGG